MFLYYLREKSVHMKVKDIQTIAKSMGLKPGKLKKSDLIHLIQKQENNNECYATSAVTSCGQENCLWRPDCLKAGSKK